MYIERAVDRLISRARASKGRRSVWDVIHRGSYPELQDLGAFRQFMVAAASRTAQVLNYSNISRRRSSVVSEILKSFSNEGLDYRDFVSYYRGRDNLLSVPVGCI